MKQGERRYVLMEQSAPDVWTPVGSIACHPPAAKILQKSLPSTMTLYDEDLREHVERGEQQVFTVDQVHFAVTTSTDMINDWLQSENHRIWVDPDRVAWNTTQILKGVKVEKPAKA